MYLALGRATKIVKKVPPKKKNIPVIIIADRLVGMGKKNLRSLELNLKIPIILINTKITIAAIMALRYSLC
jgi:hypothetical protein